MPRWELGKYIGHNKVYMSVIKGRNKGSIAGVIMSKEMKYWTHIVASGKGV